MRRKRITVILIIALGISLLGLAVFFRDSILPGRFNQRAVPELMSSKGRLAEVARYINAPVSEGGSLNNLTHFLSKEPGREQFSSYADRRRARQYLQVLNQRIGQYQQKYSGHGTIWTPEFLAVTRALFEQVKMNIFDITGYPEELTILRNPSTSNAQAATSMLGEAISEFGTTWVPTGETRAAYKPNTQQIQRHLSGNSRFKMRMEKIDQAWKNLISELYNLLRNSSWKTAAVYDPSLQKELDELILILLSENIVRHGENLLEGIPGMPGLYREAELRWAPNMAFFKNLPEFTGQTKDDNLIVFLVKMNFGYAEQDPHTRKWISNHITWLFDHCRKFFSDTVYDSVFPVGINSEWQVARLKAELIHPVNTQIVMEWKYGGRTYGLQEISFVRLQFTEIE